MKLYTNSYRQGYFIANTSYMAEYWGGTRHSQGTTGKIFNDRRRYGDQIDRTKDQLIRYLQAVINGQQSSILAWLNYYVRQGILPNIGAVDGTSFKRCYDMVQNLGFFMSNLYTKQANETDDDYYKRIVNSISESQKQFSPYRYLKQAIIQLQNSSALTTNFIINTNVINTIVERIKADMIEELMKRALQLEPNLNNQEKQKRTQTLKVQFDNLIGGKLKRMLEKAQGDQYRLSTTKGGKTLTLYRHKAKTTVDKLGKEHKNQLISLIFQPHNTDLASWMINEITTAMQGTAYGYSGSHTGGNLTRTVGEIIYKSNPARLRDFEMTNTKQVEGKDDALWEINLDDGSNIKVHFSNKLYGFRNSQSNTGVITATADGIPVDGQNILGQSSSGKNANLTRGLTDVTLEKGGRLDLRMNQLQQVFTSMPGSIYEKMIYGIVNLVHDSLLYSPGLKAQYQGMLAEMFASYMFDASYSSLIGKVPNQRDIYIFNVNGTFYTLAQVCERMISKVSLQNNVQKAKDMIKVTITPDPSTHVISDNDGGIIAGTSGIHGDGYPPYSDGDWTAVRNNIIKQTQISAMRINMLDLGI